MSITIPAKWENGQVKPLDFKILQTKNPENFEMFIVLKEKKKTTISKWQKVAERFENENFLKGESNTLHKIGKNFRENFSLS